MLNKEIYRHREQTYMKHFFLENYFNSILKSICSTHNRVVFVDGGSEPLDSGIQGYENTSFKLAINRLRYIRDNLKERGVKIVRFKCLFFEKDPSAFKQLKEYAVQIKDIRIKLVNGSFENHIDEVCKFAGSDYSLIFIDPVSCKGLQLDQIQPLFNLGGDVIINFMTDFIKSFLASPEPKTATSFNMLFGPDWFPEWVQLNSFGLSWEAAAIEAYASRLKKHGNFEYVTSTRILKLHAYRSYCHLIYATNYWKGIHEFRRVEKISIEAQEKLLLHAKAEKRKSQTGMEDLFTHSEAEEELKTKPYEAERKLQCQRAKNKLLKLIQANQRGIFYKQIIGRILEMPLVWKSDLDGFLDELKKEGKISIPGMTPRQTKIKKRNVVFPF